MKSPIIQGRGVAPVPYDSNWLPSSLRGLSLWLDGSSETYQDAARTVSASGHGTIVKGWKDRRLTTAYASGAPAASDEATIDTACYPSQSALYFSGRAIPFNTISGIAGTGRNFTLAMDYCTMSSGATYQFAGITPTQVGIYEQPIGSRFTEMVQRGSFATLPVPSTLTPGRRRVILRGTNSHLRLRMNGTNYVTSEIGGSTHTGGTIGSATAGGEVAHGVLRELIYCDSAISDSECDNIDRYWLARSAPSPLPSGTKAVLCDGNSIMAGWTGVSKDCPTGAMERQLGNTYRNLQVGKVGATAAQLTSSAASFVDVWYSASHTKNILVFIEGTNEITNGSSGATTYNNIKTYCAARKAAGWNVILSDILPATTFIGSQATAYSAALASLDADFTTATADSLVWGPAGGVTYADYYVRASRHANLSDASNTTYFNADGIHLKAAGNTILGQLWATAVALI